MTDPSLVSTDPAAPDLITVPQAAVLIHLHPDSLRRLCRAGKFDPAVHIGGRWLVSVPRLTRLLHGDREAIEAGEPTPDDPA